jgi:DNA polymerase III delta prime subunit
MHAYIVHSLEFIPDLYTLEISAPTSSIGIDQVREIQNFLSVQTAQGYKRTVIIHAAHNLTIPAQNALLKTLEEPLGEANIYLLTDQPDILLPTILSRCFIKSNNPPMTTALDNHMVEVFTKLIHQSLPQRLESIEEQEFDRQSALRFLQNIEIWLHQTKPEKIASWYLAVNQTRRLLQANCNVKMCMDCFAFDL